MMTERYTINKCKFVLSLTYIIFWNHGHDDGSECILRGTGRLHLLGCLHPASPRPFPGPLFALFPLAFDWSVATLVLLTVFEMSLGRVAPTLRQLVRVIGGGLGWRRLLGRRGTGTGTGTTVLLWEEWGSDWLLLLLGWLRGRLLLSLERHVGCKWVVKTSSSTTTPHHGVGMIQVGGGGI